MKEAAKKLGKSERTVRRLIKSWEEKGLAALAEVPRADKGQVRKSEYWYNLSLKIYKQGNKGSDHNAWAVAESVSKTPASILRSWAASVKLADVISTDSSSTTMHLACRDDFCLISTASDRTS